MRRVSLLLAALFVAGCGGSGGMSNSGSTPPVHTAKPTAPERRPAAAAILGIAGRYVDARVGDGRLPPVHVGRAGVVGKVGVVYLVGGSDVAGGGPHGLYGVLVLARQGGGWHVRPPAIRLRGHS